MACCKCLDTILECKRRKLAPPIAAARLRVELADHMRLHKLVYDDRKLRPKHHWNMDIPDQIEIDSHVIDAFVIERIHLQVKWIAENVKKTSTFEKSVLAGVTNTSLNKTTKGKIGAGLIGRTGEIAPGVTIADHMDLFGLQISCGDVVMCGGCCGEVGACCLEGDRLYVLVTRWVRVDVTSEHSDRWRPTLEQLVWRADDVTLPIAWYDVGDGCCVVVRL